MRIDASPEPDDAERAAIVEALSRASNERAEAAGGNAWWRAGVAESTRADFARDDHTAAPRRSNPGAARA